MEIQYRDTKDFTKEELEDLYLSVEWESGKYPEKLVSAMRNSHKVISAWDGEKLVGLMNALSDGHMTAYFHYLLVRPEYQGQGIGKRLVAWMMQEYKDCFARVLISYNGKVDFYKSCGLKPSEVSIPMYG